MLRAEGEEEVEPVGPAGLGLQLRSTDFRFCCIYYTTWVLCGPKQVTEPLWTSISSSTEWKSACSPGNGCGLVGSL